MSFTRSSVLGKRSYTADIPSSSVCDQLQTPDPTPNPKRPRTSTTLDGDHNKENVAPLLALISDGVSLASPRATRALRRTMTESIITPPRGRPSAFRRASMSSPISPSTPTAEIAQLSIATPPPSPPVTLASIPSRTRALLRATCNDGAEISGRDVERTTIKQFINSFIDASSIDSGDASTLYISGTPGTGKTALVNCIIRDIGLSASPDVNVVTINCMALTTVKELWERLADVLNPSPIALKKTKKKLGVEAIVAALDKKSIVILDEIDHITPNSQSLNTLLSLPSSNAAMIRLIGIANTHTLSASTVGLASASEIRTLHFAPYTSTSLLKILQSRLSPLLESSVEETRIEAKAFLPLPSLTLLSKKIASLSGDVRSLFEVFRGAIELASLPLSEKGGKKASAVAPAHILAALKAHTSSSGTITNAQSSGATSSSSSNSEIVSKIQSLGIQARLVLLLILITSKRLQSGLSLSSPSGSSSAVNKAGKCRGVDSAQLHAYYSTVLTRDDAGIFAPVSRSEFGDLVGMLEGVGLIATTSSPVSSSPVKGGKRSFGRSASFGGGSSSRVGSTDVALAPGVWMDEVLRGLGVGSKESADVKEEELSAIWQHENARIAREVKALTRKTATCGTFADSTED